MPEFTVLTNFGNKTIRAADASAAATLAARGGTVVNEVLPSTPKYTLGGRAADPTPQRYSIDRTPITQPPPRREQQRQTLTQPTRYVAPITQIRQGILPARFDPGVAQSLAKGEGTGYNFLGLKFNPDSDQNAPLFDQSLGVPAGGAPGSDGITPAQLPNRTDPLASARRQVLEAAGVINPDGTFALSVPDEEDLREKITDQMRGRITSIEQAAEQIRQAQGASESDRAGQLRARQSRGGLIGSSFGAAQSTRQSQQFVGERAQIEGARTQAIDTILLDVEDRVQTAIEAAQARVVAGGNDFVNFVDQEAQDVQSAAALLANSGMELEDLDPEFKSRLEAAGGFYNDMHLTTWWNANKPRPEQIEYEHVKLADGTVMLYGTDPKTGKMVSETFSVDLPTNMELKIAADGTPLIFDPATGIAQIAPGFTQGQFDDPETETPGQNLRTITIGGLPFLLDPATGEITEITDASGQSIVAKEDKEEAVKRVETAEKALEFMQKLLAHPGFSAAIGARGPSAYFPGGRGKGAIQLHESLVDILTLENMSLMTGVLSDTDIKILKNASAAINRDLSEKDYKKNLKDIEDRLRKVIEAQGFRGDTGGSNPLDDALDEVLGGTFDSGSGTAMAQGMRTDRHNNPTAFTVAVARQAGLREGVDYEKGDPFPNNPNAFTARLLSDPVETTRKVIDNIGFYTRSGQPRWNHTAIPKNEWDGLSTREKDSIIARMYQKEGNQGALNKFFA